MAFVSDGHPRVFLFDDHEREWRLSFTLLFSQEELELNLRYHIKWMVYERDGLRDDLFFRFNPPAWGWVHRRPSPGDDLDERTVQARRFSFRPKDDERVFRATPTDREEARGVPGEGGRRWDWSFRQIDAGIHVTEESADGTGEPEEYRPVLLVYNDLSPVVMSGSEFGELSLDLQIDKP